MKIQRFEYWFKSRIYVFSMEIVLIYVFLTLDIVANTMTVHPDNEVGKCSKYNHEDAKMYSSILSISNLCQCSV